MQLIRRIRDRSSESRERIPALDQIGRDDLRSRPSPGCELHVEELLGEVVDVEETDVVCGGVGIYGAREDELRPYPPMGSPRSKPEELPWSWETKPCWLR